MAHDVIMPMLGMVQDTGIIVSWHKEIGDAVKASDVLMEVETDKATVEIEAGFDGFVTALRAETGVPVPVGQVVAVISDDKSDVEAAPAATAEVESAPAAPSETAEAKPEAEKKEPAAAPAAKMAPTAKPQVRPQAGAGGRILASPKARRLAKERGVDLGRLVRLGVPEPIHVADLDKAGAAAFGTTAASLMRVTIARAPFDAFQEWLAGDAGTEVDVTNLWAAFAAGSLRSATDAGRNAEIVVDASRFPSANGPFPLRNPDRAGLSELTTEPATGGAALTILDLTETVLTDYRPAGEAALPHLTICNGPDSAHFDLYLAFDPAILAAETAYAFLKELADRTQVPLRHVL